MQKHNLIFIIFIFFLINGCSSSESCDCNCEPSQVTVLRGGIVTQGVENIDSLYITYDKLTPIIIYRDSSTIVKRKLVGKEWEKKDILTGTEGNVSTFQDDEKLYLLDYGNDKMILYSFDQEGSISVLDMFEELHIEKSIESKVSYAKVKVLSDSILIPFVYNDSEIYLASKSVTGSTEWSLQKITGDGVNSSGFFHSADIFTNPSGYFTMLISDAGWGRIIVADGMNNEWHYAYIKNTQNRAFSGPFYLNFDSHGVTDVFFFESVNHNLYYSTVVTNEGEVSVLDDSGYFGEYLDGVTRQDGSSYIFYYDGEYGMIKVAYKTSEQWKKKIVYSAGISGILLDVSLRDNDVAGLVFLDIVNNNLIFTEISLEMLR